MHSAGRVALGHSCSVKARCIHRKQNAGEMSHTVTTVLGGSSVDWGYCLRGGYQGKTQGLVTVCPAHSAVGPSVQNTRQTSEKIKSYVIYLEKRARVICLWDLTSYCFSFYMRFFLSWKTTNGQEKKRWYANWGCCIIL